MAVLTEIRPETYKVSSSSFAHEKKTKPVISFQPRNFEDIRREEGVALGSVKVDYTYKNGKKETVQLAPGTFVLQREYLPALRALCAIVAIDPPGYLEAERTSAVFKNEINPQVVNEEALVQDFGDRVIPALFYIQNKAEQYHFDDELAQFLLDRTPEGTRRAEEFLATARGPQNEYDEKGNLIKSMSDSCSNVIGTVAGKPYRIHPHGKINGNDKIALAILALAGDDRAARFAGILTENNPDLATVPFGERAARMAEITLTRGMHENDQVEIETMTVAGEAYATASVLAAFVHNPQEAVTAKQFEILSREKIVGKRDIFIEQPPELQKADEALENALVQALKSIRAETGGKSDNWRGALAKLFDDAIALETIQNARFNQQPADKNEANMLATIAFAIELELQTRAIEAERVPTTVLEKEATQHATALREAGFRYPQHGMGEASNTIRHFEYDKRTKQWIRCESHSHETKELLLQASQKVVAPLKEIAGRTEVKAYQQKMQQIKPGGSAQQEPRNHAHKEHDHEKLSEQEVRMLKAVNSLRVPKETEALDSKEAWKDRMQQVAETTVHIASLSDTPEAEAVRTKFNEQLFYGVIDEASLRERPSDALRARREELTNMVTQSLKEVRAKSSVASEVIALTIAKAMESSIQAIIFGDKLPTINQITPKDTKFVISVLAYALALETQPEAVVKTEKEQNIIKLAKEINEQFGAYAMNPSKHEKGAFHFNERIKGGQNEADPCPDHTAQSTQTVNQINQQSKQLANNSRQPQRREPRVSEKPVMKGGSEEYGTTKKFGSSSHDASSQHTESVESGAVGRGRSPERQTRRVESAKTGPSDSNRLASVRKAIQEAIASTDSNASARKANQEATVPSVTYTSFDNDAPLHPKPDKRSSGFMRGKLKELTRKRRKLLQGVTTVASGGTPSLVIPVLAHSESGASQKVTAIKPLRLIESTKGQMPDNVPAGAKKDAPLTAPNFYVRSQLRVRETVKGASKERVAVVVSHTASGATTSGHLSTPSGDPNNAERVVTVSGKTKSKLGNAVTGKKSAEKGPFSPKAPKTLNSTRQEGKSRSLPEESKVTGETLAQAVTDVQVSEAIAKMNAEVAEQAEETGQTAQGGIAETVARTTHAGDSKEQTTSHSASVDAGVATEIETRNQKGEGVKVRLNTARDRVTASQSRTENQPVADAATGNGQIAVAASGTSMVKTVAIGTQEREAQLTSTPPQPPTPPTDRVKRVKNRQGQGHQTATLAAAVADTNKVGPDVISIKELFRARLAAAQQALETDSIAA
ncbi:MAG TPA: hypothetical protein VNW29_02815 [Candidatus Sulfotelmatobacter sp.]|jgi:hypothetical protein|nr:hypothetical protein [Candidatus Sulfotelmatobacter sp.]